MIIINVFTCEEEQKGIYSAVSFAELSDQARLIRTRLGKQVYLLDNYLSALMEPLNHKLPQNVAVDGFEAMGKLFAICVSVCRGDIKYNDHWFYSRVTEYIRNHPIQYQEPHTLANIYCVLLSEEYGVPALERYLNDARGEPDNVTDECELSNLYPRSGRHMPMWAR